MGTTLTTNEQKAFLRRIGLPASTPLQRRSSWRKFQRASAWAAYDPAARKVGPLDLDGRCGPATTTHARVSMNNGYRISPHFRLTEFACGCGGTRLGCRRVWYSRNMIIKLEQLRDDLYPHGLTILSGYRCRRFNATLPGSAKDSAHLDGYAADIPQRHRPDAFKGRGFHGIEARKLSGLVSHVDLKPRLAVDTVFWY